MTVHIAATTCSQHETVWAEEVARLMGADMPLEPAAHAAVLTVLKSLADDTTELLGTRREVRALLAVLDVKAARATPADDLRAPARRDRHAAFYRAVHLLCSPLLPTP